jgi:hypothetical protein
MSKFLLYAGLLSIPFSISLWYYAPVFNQELFAAITDEHVRKALEAANSERWGIFVGLWAPTLLLLSQITKE